MRGHTIEQRRVASPRHGRDVVAGCISAQRPREQLSSDGRYALPREQGFWDMLLGTARRWGMQVYEQDWLDNEFDNFAPLGASATLGREWLFQAHATPLLCDARCYARRSMLRAMFPSLLDALLRRCSR